MSELDDLIAACRATPDDDAPRLVWADAVGGERGELVVIQCRLAREELSPAERAALRRRNDELLDRHGVEWSGIADLAGAKRCMFRRGFVESVQLDVLATPWTTIFERVPLVACLSLDGLAARIDYTESETRQGADSIAWLGQMFEQPELRRLRGLEIDGVVLYEITGDSEWDFSATSLADQLLELIAKSGRLAGLRALGICDTIKPRGMHELLGSNALADLERIAFEFGETDRSQAIALFAHAPKLRAIDVHAAMNLAEMADVIPASISELRCFGLHDDDFPALARSPVARSLERLQVTGSGLAKFADRFGAFPNVRALDVGFSSLNSGMAEDDGSTQHAAVPIFCASTLPALRELRLFSNLTNESALMIAEAFGSQLERFDVLGHDDLTCIDELRAKVAGEVLAGAYRFDDPILEVGINTIEPWIRYGVVVIRR